jgi:hypothetical protein
MNTMTSDSKQARANRINGSKSKGRKKGYQPIGVVPKIGVDEIVEIAATRMMENKRPLVPSALSGCTVADEKRISRILNTSIEVFNQKMAERLAVLSDKIADRIEEKVDEDAFKANELGFIFSVTEDKRRALDARAMLGASQVNIQVNHYGDRSREEIMKALSVVNEPMPSLITHEP